MLRLSSLGRMVLVTGAAAMLAAACGGNGSGSASPSPVDVGSGSLVGAGATFPGPFYQKAFTDYSAKYPQVTVNYQPVGSGAGIKQFQAKTVDFGASDVPMGSADITTAGGPDALTQIPTTLGVVSIAFNISGVNSLNLDGPTLANIYLKHITNWNDPALATLNSGTTLPNKAITVVHRSDGSGTTFHFTDYLSKVSDEWKTKVGNAKSVSWPTGVGGSGNQAVAQAVQSTDGSIGYVELAYVVQTGMKQASLKNANGKFVQASVDGAKAAAATNTSVGPTNFSITNAACDACYPISGFSWVILYTNYSDSAKGKAVVYLFKWLVTSGQSDGSDLQYAPLPSAVQQLALTNLKLIKANGTTVLSS
ncbi:MAG TPA: phosphate ABC transporter substrate-binding protein PstS [Candidatus Dormibacteraeota bacterium]|nr:phosphate ABC transporter substrate-binding protein PstS [Candidatus Dormibacteraeota bacterium]